MCSFWVQGCKRCVYSGVANYQNTSSPFEAWFHPKPFEFNFSSNWRQAKNLHFQIRLPGGNNNCLKNYVRFLSAGPGPGFRDGLWERAKELEDIDSNGGFWMVFTTHRSIIHTHIKQNARIIPDLIGAEDTLWSIPRCMHTVSANGVGLGVRGGGLGRWDEGVFWGPTIPLSPRPNPPVSAASSDTLIDPISLDVNGILLDVALCGSLTGICSECNGKFAYLEAAKVDMLKIRFNVTAQWAVRKSSAWRAHLIGRYIWSIFHPTIKSKSSTRFSVVHKEAHSVVFQLPPF